MVNVLIFPAGSEVGLEIERAFRYVRNVTVFGASSVEDHSAFTFRRLGKLPFVGDPEFIGKFELLVEELEIDYVFPAHDDVIVALAKWASTRPESMRPAIISSGYETDAIARSKRATYKALWPAVAVPKEYRPEDIGVKADRPLFVKPDCGQGSKGTRKIIEGDPIGPVSAEQLLLEYLPGKEFTIDCLTDRYGHLRFARARERIRTSNGISVCTAEVQRPELLAMAEIINNTLSFRGMWFFQAKMRGDGTPALLEIATRVSGGMGYFRGKGVNLPLLALYDRVGKDIEIFTNDFDLRRDSALYPKYSLKYKFSNIYIDLDDTLICQGMVNSELMGLIYRWRNQGKEIRLITRHRAVHGISPQDTLRHARISPEIFEDIVEVANDEAKSSKITKYPAIFVDDSHRERHDVHKNCNIPTFDCQQAIEVLS